MLYINKEEKIVLIQEEDLCFIVHEVKKDYRKKEKLYDIITQNILYQNTHSLAFLGEIDKKILKFRKFRIDNHSIQTLYSYVKNNGTLSEEKIRKIFSNIVEMITMHIQRGYVVCNLRLEKILYDEDKNDIFILDMHPFQREYGCSFGPYFAPEMVDEQNIESMQLVSWMMGSILYFLTFSKWAFLSYTETCNKEIHQEVINAPRSDRLKTCIIGLLSKNKNHRLKISDIYDDELFQY